MILKDFIFGVFARMFQEKLWLFSKTLRLKHIHCHRQTILDDT